MIAIFYTKQESIDFSNLIHQFLLANRNGYNATNWSDTDKSDSEEKWAISLPNDYETLGGIIIGLDLIQSLPENWNIIEEDLMV